MVTIADAPHRQENLVTELELRLDAECIRMVVLRDVHRQEPHQKSPEGCKGDDA